MTGAQVKRTVLTRPLDPARAPESVAICPTAKPQRFEWSV